MPSWELFEHQTQEHQDNVLPPQVTARVPVEEASTFGWERYIGMWGPMIGMKTFGASALLKELQKKFGFEPDKVAAAAKELLGGKYDGGAPPQKDRRSPVMGMEESSPDSGQKSPSVPERIQDSHHLPVGIAW
jgi:transketolase